MKKNLTRIAPLQAGIVSALFYGLITFLIIPFFFIPAFFGFGNSDGVGFGLIFLIMMPIFYTIGGFIGGVIAV